jgi:hypothetical protein
MFEILKLSRIISSSSPKKLELELEEATSFYLASCREGETLVGLYFFITIILEDSNFRIFTDSWIAGKTTSCLIYCKLLSIAP